MKSLVAQAYFRYPQFIFSPNFFSIIIQVCVFLAYLLTLKKSNKRSYTFSMCNKKNHTFRFVVLKFEPSTFLGDKILFYTSLIRLF